MTEGSFPLPAVLSAQAPPAVMADAPGSGSQILARMLFEIRRVPRRPSRITPDIEAKVMNRCVVAALEVLSAADASVELAGTPARPVVEASFEGEEAAARAARAAGRVLASVRRVQRAAENEFQVVGALTVGSVTRTSGGVAITTGSSDGALHRLRERAAPGQILLSAGAVEACHGLLDAVPAPSADGPAPEEAYVYLGLRSRDPDAPSRDHGTNGLNGSNGPNGDGT